jgi:hypothetical protein
MVARFIFGNHHWDHLTRQFEELLRVQRESLEVQKAILKAVLAASQKQAAKLAIHFGSQAIGEVNMALRLPVGQTDQYYITSDAPLATGQTIAVVSGDPTVVLTPDATPAIDPKTNIQSVASGSVAIGPSPVLGTAVTVTATLTAADGVTVVDTETDTVTPVSAGAKKIGILFEDASVSPSPAG